jgi:hypothetical protein
VESPNKDTSLILSSFEDAVKTYDLTWRIREASEASTRELYSSSQKEATSAGLPSSLESTTTATAGPTGTIEEEKGGKGLMDSVKEGVEKLGLGGKTG